MAIGVRVQSTEQVGTQKAISEASMARTGPSIGRLQGTGRALKYALEATAGRPVHPGQACLIGYIAPESLSHISHVLRLLLPSSPLLCTCRSWKRPRTAVTLCGIATYHCDR